MSAPDTSTRVVLDASALGEVLLSTRRGARVARWLSQPGVEAHAPHLLVPDCLSILRGWRRSDQIDDHLAVEAVTALERFPVRLWDERPFLPAAWQLRHNVSAYDAQYVVLARALDATLLTADPRLARQAPDCAVKLDPT